MPLKDRLRELRKAADLTQQDLANKADLSISAVVQIEAGKIPDPRISTLKALAKALGVTVDELISDDDAGRSASEAEEKPKRPRGRPKKGK